MKRFNFLNSPFLRRAGLGLVILLCCAAAALAWFAPPQSAFAFFTGGENPQPKQTAISPAEKSDAVKQASAPRPKRDGEENSQDGVWREVQFDSLSGGVSEGVPETARVLELNPNALVKILDAAPNDSTERLTDLSESESILQLPMPDGGFMRFRLADSPVMEAEMQAKYPEIRSYRGQSIDDLRVSTRLDFSPLGLHATILTADKLISIHPARNDGSNTYVSYYGEDFKGKPFSCGVAEAVKQHNNAIDSIMEDAADDVAAAPSVATGAKLRTYRFAVATTGEYYQDPALGGGSSNNSEKDKAVASINIWVNAVNLIYVRELAVKLILIENTAESKNIIFTDGATDGLTNGNAGAMNNEIQPILESKMGLDKFDIGHVFGKDGDGGVAVLGATCATGADNFPSKIRGGGASGLSAPLGNAASLKILAHEIGHQFNAPHTWNGCKGGARSTSTAVEVGSGSTIMGYGGSCENDNLLGENDSRFHAMSLKNMNDHINSYPQCGVLQDTGNVAPVVDAGAGYTIPKLTPFSLTASATDANDDVKNLTYTWEQFDAGGSLYPNPPYGDQASDPDTTTRPIFRAFPPTSNPTRVFPSLEYILNNANNPPETVQIPWGSGTQTRQTGEKLPSVARTLKFRVTARDNNSNGGGTSDDDTRITVVGTAGPFAVTAPNAANTTWTSETTQTVTWAVNNTNVAPVNAANVKISLSVDGGQTFPIVLADSVPNNGSASVAVPKQIQTAMARVKIEALGNIFFDISDANFTINNGASCPTITGIAPDAGTIGTKVKITGTSFTTGMTVKFSGDVTATTVNVINSTTLEAIVPSGATSGAITISKTGCAAQQTAPFRVCTGSPQELKVDKDTQNASYTDKYHVNRLTPPNGSYPATLTHVKIYFGNNNAAVGEQLTILAGANTDGDTNINNTAFQQLAVTVQQVGQYNTYALDTPITVTQGDFVVGYKLTTGRTGAADDNEPQSRSYYSNGDGTNFALTTGTNYKIRGQFTTNCPDAPTTTISPGSQSFNASAGNGTINVTASSAWTATSNNSWITITSGASGTGNGVVVYSVTQNNTGAARTGTITVAGQTFTVTQTACAIGFSPSLGTTLGAAGGNFEISVFSPAGCPWSVTNIPSWITVTSGANGSNNGTIKYLVQANIAKTSRTGTMTIGGQSFTVTQNACPDSATMIFDDDVVTGGNSRGYNVVRLTPTSHPATLTHVRIYFNDSWGTTGRNFEILAGKNEDGDANVNGSIQQTVPVNSGTIRNAYVAFALTTPITITKGDFVVGFKVAEAAGFFPRASENIAPIQNRSYQSGDNGATLVPDANADYKIRADYKSFCPDGTISPESRSVSGGGASGTVSVTSSIAWTAYSNDDWIKVNSAASGTGNGSVSYTVAPNTTGAARTGTLTIAGRVFTVTQDACFINFAPGNATVGSGGGNFTISVPAGCGSWTATSASGWIKVTSGASGTGNGTVGYKVEVNTMKAARTGTINIAGQTFTVTQTACGDLNTMKLDEDNVSNGGGSGGYNVVRLTPPTGSYPATLTHVQIYFNDNWATGKSFELVAGKNESGLADINNVTLQTFPANSGAIRNAYTTFQLPTPITITQGDFVVGFKVTEAAGFFPLSGDKNAPIAGRSYYRNGATFQNDLGQDYKIRGQYQLTCSNTTAKPISPPSFNNSGGSGNVSVSGADNPTAMNNDPWITILNNASSANGAANYLVTSNGVVSYIIAPNDTGEDRIGSITINGQIFYIYQAGYGRSIGGTIGYGANNTKTVPDVVLAAQGTDSFSTTTSLSGAYLLPGLTEGEDFTVTPSKSNDVNGITAFDATLVLRCVAAGQNCALTQNQRTAADANGDENLTAFDATQILRFVAAAGQNSATGQVGAWKFELPSRTYNNLTTDPTAQDYTAFLIGDVNGDWQSPTNSNTAKSTAQKDWQNQYLPEVELSFSGKVGKRTVDSETIPVWLTNPSGARVSSFRFNIAYNKSMRQSLDLAIATAGTLAESCVVTVNTDIPGRIGVAGACPKSVVATTGNLLNLRFTAPLTRSKGASLLAELAFSQTSVIEIEDGEGNLISIAKTN